MENTLSLLIVLVIVLAVFSMVTIIIPLIKKQGIDVGGTLATTATALNAANTVIDTLRGIFPTVPAFTLIDQIIGWAQKGAAAAEQLYKTSQIQADQRKAEATALVYEFIHVAGVELDDEMQKIVDGAIEAAVFALPKTHQ